VTATLLLIAAALLHAVWNNFARKVSPSRRFYFRAELCMALFTLPGWMWLPRVLQQLEPSEWALLPLTTFCQACYYSGLARLYRAGDLSWSYPMLRTGPVVLLAAAALPFGNVRALPLLGAVLLAVLGARAVSRKKHGSGAHPWGALGIAILAVCGYTLCDARLGPAFARAGYGVTLSTLCLVSLFSAGNSAWLFLFSRGATDPVPWKASALTSLGIWGSYALILAAMTTPLPPHLVALFRLLGIPFTLLIARLLLREPVGLRRALGSLALAAAALLGKLA